MEKLKTPCFICDERELVSSIQGFKSALERRFLYAIVGYSVKTNSLPYLLKVMSKEGCYAEVVSYHEYRTALKCGFSKDKIIYNGPFKSKDTFMDAVLNGSIVNIETWREIEWLKELPAHNIYKVGIRLNVDISQISSDDENHPNDDSRFGFSNESGDFREALNRLSGIENIRIVGLHTHRTSRTRSLSFYRHIIEYAQQIIRNYSLILEYWDLGGGYFGTMPEKPTYEQYAQIFFDSLDEHLRNIKIIVEPGNALVASAFDYVATVIDVKFHNNQYYVCCDGTRNDIDPFFHKESYFKQFLYAETKGSLVNNKQVVSGLTCLEYDRLFVIEKKERLLVEGDQIYFSRVGAYTMCLTPLFIHYFPNVYLKKQDGTMALIREEWTEEEFIQKSNI